MDNSKVIEQLNIISYHVDELIQQAIDEGIEERAAAQHSAKLELAAKHHSSGAQTMRVETSTSGEDALDVLHSKVTVAQLTLYWAIVFAVLLKRYSPIGLKAALMLILFGNPIGISC